MPAELFCDEYDDYVDWSAMNIENGLTVKQAYQRSKLNNNGEPYVAPQRMRMPIGYLIDGKKYPDSIGFEWLQYLWTVALRYAQDLYITECVMRTELFIQNDLLPAQNNKRFNRTRELKGQRPLYPCSAFALTCIAAGRPLLPLFQKMYEARFNQQYQTFRVVRPEAQRPPVLAGWANVAIPPRRP